MWSRVPRHSQIIWSIDRNEYLRISDVFGPGDSTPTSHTPLLCESYLAWGGDVHGALAA
jgi:hypothetical protein